MNVFATIIFSDQTWLLPAAVLVVVLAAALVWASRSNSTERSVRILCGLLKTVGILALAFCLLDPLWVGQRARPGANFFAVIADNSQSLQIKDAGEPQSRGDILGEHLSGKAKDWQSALEENFQVRRYTFDTRLQTTRDFGELNFDGRSSALGNALRTATEQWRGQPMAGVLLFSDGNATDIASDLSALENCPPIYPVVLGEDKNIPDISLKKVGVTQTAFEDAPVTIQAQVESSGFSGTEIVTRLTEIEVGTTSTNASRTNEVHTKTTSVLNVAELKQRATSGDLNFRFQIQPDKPGLHFYELETRSRDEFQNSNSPSREATLVNNRQMIVVDRGQELFRVLYVSGRPNWEYKFFNRAIQEDTQVQMVSLIRVARREPKFEFKGRAGESSNPLFRGFDRKNEETARYDQPVLVRLNTKDEFELRGGFPKTAEELFRYHAVILDDVESEFFSHDQMALLQRFVSERGGGFLMLGGPESFREGNYAPTPVAAMLPVYLDRPRTGKLPSQLKLTLTRDGWLEPWTRLRSTETEEKTRLDIMPAFEVVNASSEIKPGATVLATVSGSDEKAYPALVVQRFGLGRSAALLVGDLWRWGFKDETMQQDLAKSWRQLVRWLVADVPPRIQVTVEPSLNGNPGEVRLSVKAHDEKFKPLENANVRLTVRPVRLAGSQNEKASSPISGTNYVQMTAEPSATNPGMHEAAFVARNSGAYSVEALVTQSDGKIVGNAVAGWTSDPAAEEFRHIKPNRLLLETIAKKTKGEVVAMADVEKFVRSLPQRHAPITETWTQPLWHKPIIFLFVLGCFVAEWGIRRWKGLP